MRTAIIIVGGLVLLGVFAFMGSRMGGGAQGVVAAAKAFLPLWLTVAVVNLWIGVARAGYSVAEELPILLVIFGIPGAVAGFMWWKYS